MMPQLVFFVDTGQIPLASLTMSVATKGARVNCNATREGHPSLTYSTVNASKISGKDKREREERDCVRKIREIVFYCSRNGELQLFLQVNLTVLCVFHNPNRFPQPFLTRSFHQPHYTSLTTYSPQRWGLKVAESQ